MLGEHDFQRRLEIIERAIRDLKRTPDAGLRATVLQLVQSILELHGQSLERLLDIVHASGVAGPPIIDQLGRNPLVSHLLLLHSLHPLSLEGRVQDALDKVRPQLQSKHGDVELLAIADGDVRVRLLGGPEQKAAIERAIMDAAPDVVSLEIEGTVDTFVGFVPLGSLRGTKSAAAPAGARVDA